MSSDSYYLGRDDGYKEGYADAKKEHQPHWIPCSERLPEEGEFVLVTFGWFGQDGDYAVNIDHIKDGDWLFSNRVTAWMPLPSPYQPEEE